MPETVELSVVVPVNDAIDRLPQLNAHLMDVLSVTHPSHEVIYVDDASRDGTWELLRELSTQWPTVQAVRLAESSGQVAAILVGWTVSSGDFVATMDDDLEIDARCLDLLLAEVEQGADFVSGRRTGPRSPVRSLGSAMFNARVRSWGYPYHDLGCAFTAMPATVAKELAASGSLLRDHRIKLFIAQRFEHVVEVPVPSTRTTSSHFGINSLVSSWFDVEATFGRGPMLLWAWIGVAAMVSGVLTLVIGLWTGAVLTIGGALLALLGAGLIGIGLVGNQVLRVLRSLERPEAQIAERAGT